MGAAIPHGLTSSLDQNVLLDLRASDGTPATGKTYSDVTLKTIYDDDADNPTTETLVAGTLGSFVSNGFVEAAAGGYQYSIPNARLATAGKRFTIEVSGSGILTKRFRVIVYDANSGFGNPAYIDQAISGVSGSSIVVPVISVNLTTPVLPRDLTAYWKAPFTHQVRIRDSQKQPVDMSAQTLKAYIGLKNQSPLHTIDCTVDEVDTSIVNIPATAENHPTIGKFDWSLRDETDFVWGKGEYDVEFASGPQVGV